MNRTMAQLRRAVALAAAPLLAATLAVVAAAPGASAAPAPARHATTGHPGLNLARLPVAFARNDGQAPRTVRYLGQTQGVSIVFTATGVTLDLAHDPARHAAAGPQRPGQAQVTLAFRHQSRHVRITGARREPGTVNYFTGSNRTRWHTRIPSYARVVYHDLWPGVTATFTTRDGTLTYWFTIAPGASASEIRLAYTGARHLAITRTGALAIATPAGTLTDQAPASTERISGHTSRLASQYRLTGPTSFSYTLAPHPRHAAVTIDPGLAYSTFLGGNAGSACAAPGVNSTIHVDSIQADAAGDIYLFGATCSASFPTTPGAYRTHKSSKPSSLSFVTKFNPTGTHLIYSTFIGGTHGGVGRYYGPLGSSYGSVDSSGDAFVAGPTFSTDFPTTAGAYQTRANPVTSQGINNMSVAFELNPTGSRLVYSTYLSGFNVSAGALGPGGTLTVVGSASTDLLPVTFGGFQTHYQGGTSSGYVARLNAAGTGLVYATYLGAPISRQILQPNGGGGQACWQGDVPGIAVDAHGAAYIAGTCTTGFPTTPGAYQRTGVDDWLGDGDVLVVKLNPSGTGLGYVTYFDTPADVQSGTSVFAHNIQVDKAGDAYISTATTPGGVPATEGAYASTCPAGSTICGSVAEFNPTGGLVYSSYLPGDGGGDLAIDGSGDAYITATDSTRSSMPTTPGAYSTKPGKFPIPFWLGVLAKGGGSLLYGSYLGGAASPNGGCVLGICGPSGYLLIAPHAANGHVYLGGVTNARYFPVTSGAYQTSYPKALNSGFAAELTLPSLSAAARHGGYKPPAHRVTTAGLPVRE